MTVGRKLITSEDAVPSSHQHKRPCSDCPWRRDSLAGWLGDQSKEAWLQDAHGEARIDCHTLIGPQCAGAAIFRSNICKHPRDKSLLILPSDKAVVFGSSVEFSEHHDMARIVRELKGENVSKQQFSYKAVFADGQSKEIARSGRQYAAAWQVKVDSASDRGVVTIMGFSRTRELAAKALVSEARGFYGKRPILHQEVIDIFPGAPL